MFNIFFLFLFLKNNIFFFFISTKTTILRSGTQCTPSPKVDLIFHIHLGFEFFINNFLTHLMVIVLQSSIYLIYFQKNLLYFEQFVLPC